MPDWDAEVTIDEELVRGLLVEQFPDLDIRSGRFLAEGWDNAVWIVEEQWAFRFPRRAIAVPGVERELAILPRIAPLVPLSVPVPVHIGHPSERYPWPWFGCRFLPGQEPAEVDLSDEVRAELAIELGRFLRALHAPDVAAAVDPEGVLPVDPNLRMDMPARAQIARRWLGELEGLGLWSPDERVEHIFDAACELPPPRGLAVVHGDLHFRHVLVASGRFSGVIDWGDVCRADPAVDLQLAWSFLPPAGREAFLHEYGSFTEAQMLRARVLAMSLCAALCAYGRHECAPKVEQEALAGLERTLVDWD